MARRTEQSLALAKIREQSSTSGEESMKKLSREAIELSLQANKPFKLNIDQVNVTIGSDDEAAIPKSS